MMFDPITLIMIAIGLACFSLGLSVGRWVWETKDKEREQ